VAPAPSQLVEKFYEGEKTTLRIVYATGSPRSLEFHLTDTRRAVPQGAHIFAICTGGQTIQNQDEDLFESITDEEYYTVRRMVSEAERVEKEGGQASRNVKPIRRLFNWLSSLFSGGRSSSSSGGGDTGRKQSTAKSSASPRRSMTRIQQGY
jgi:hypothetical protein